MIGYLCGKIVRVSALYVCTHPSVLAEEEGVKFLLKKNKKHPNPFHFH